MRVELISSPYDGRGLIASGQECVNLYAEINKHDPQAPAKVTYYPTPGTVLYADPNFLKKARASYRTSLGTAFYVVGQNVYFLSSTQTLIFIGAIVDRPSQIYFSDNGIVAVLVDGLNGYAIDLATMDVLVCFIMQDQQGNGIVVQGQGYDIIEISIPRVVSEFKSYSTLSDAIGFCFQIEDHPFYALIFPTAEKGWLYDLLTKQWNEWNWCDDNGNLLRPRANCCMFAYGSNLVG